MNWTRFALCIVVVFIAQAAVAGALQVGVVDRHYDSTTLFRGEGEERLLPYFISRVLFVTVFAYLFIRAFPRSGVAAGLTYGLLIWLFYSIPMTVGFWAFLRMPDGLALAWIGIGLGEMLVGGLALGLLYSPPMARHPG